MQIGSALSTAGVTGGTSAAGESSAKRPGSVVDYDSFLQLLVAQLKNQDPMNPADSTEFVSQLATLSGLEQSIKQNEKLDQMLSSIAVGYAGSIVGHSITSADGQTTGTVVAAKVTTQGVTATLDNGKEITLEPGVVIRA